jgi:DNA-binding SARP family transcriptional activator
MSLRIRLLGSVAIQRGERIVALGAVKRLALVAALALSANQPVSLDDLSDAIWSDEPPRSAVANLRTKGFVSF